MTICEIRTHGARRVSRLLMVVFLGLTLGLNSARSDAASSVGAALKNFDAQMFDYFRQLPDPAIPIFLPAGEQPGDAYQDYYGGFEARKGDCFPTIKVDPAPSSLPAAIDTEAKALQGSLGANLAKALDAGADGGLKFDDRVSVRFDQVKVFVVSNYQLRKALRERDKGCANVAAVVLHGQALTSGVMVLGQVFVGRKVMETGVQNSTSVNAKASGTPNKLLEKIKGINEVLAKLDLKIEAQGALTGSQSSEQHVTLSDERELPIAYKPAFISLEHVRKIIDLKQKRVLEDLDARSKSVGGAVAARDKYPEFVIPPEKTWYEMQAGHLVSYDPKNPEHDEYLRACGLLMALGAEAYPRRR